jgi:hypothetical protein
MAGKQAKILSEANIDDLLLFAETKTTFSEDPLGGHKHRGRLLRLFGLTSFLFRPFDLAGSLDRPALGSARSLCHRSAIAGSAILARNFSNATFRPLAAASWRLPRCGPLTALKWWPARTQHRH